MEVLEPCSNVELAVDCVDPPGTVHLLRLSNDDTDDGPWAWNWCSVGRLPANADGAAAWPVLKHVEVDGCLRTLARLERLTAGEGRAKKRNKGSCVASWALVDEGVDALGVVVEVLGQDLVGEGLGVVCDEGAVVGSKRQCLSSRHALAASLLNHWCGIRASDSETREGEGLDGNHFR